MKPYDFTLKFALPAGVNAETIVERLYDAGCDDALAGTGQAGRLALAFTRKANSAHEALLGALANVRSAVPEAILVEASPDFVGLTDVAGVLGCSRQNVRKMVLKHAASFPSPVHEGVPAIWRLVKVLAWAKASGKKVDANLLEVAEAAQQVNLARECSDLNPELQRKLRHLVAGDSRRRA